MASDDGSIAAFLGLSLPPSIQRWSLAEVISFIEAKRNPSLRKYLRRHLGKIRDRAGSSSSSEGDPKLLSTLTGSAATSKLVRALHKLVLSTFIAARPELQKASRQSLKALGLKGPQSHYSILFWVAGSRAREALELLAAVGGQPGRRPL